MDTETKVLLTGLAALAAGVTLGWYLKMSVRRGNFRASTAGKPSATAIADGSAPFTIPAGPAPAACNGCRG